MWPFMGWLRAGREVAVVTTEGKSEGRTETGVHESLDWHSNYQMNR